jgi:radical SAM enzyme (TIGR01210 family)
MTRDENIQQGDSFRERMLSLPDDRYVTEFVNPLLSILLSRDRRETRHGRIIQEKLDVESCGWGSFNLPPAPGTTGEVKLIYLDSGGGGCSHQTLNGGCFGCDYHGSLRKKRTKEEMSSIINAVFEDLENGGIRDFFQDKKIVDLNIIASGSLLDPLEIYNESRNEIFGRAKNYQENHQEKEVNFETEARYDDFLIYDSDARNWSINEALIIELESLGKGLKGGKVTVGVGLESVNPLVSEGCINKHLPSMAEIKKLHGLLREKYPHVFLLPHIWLGTNFLTEEERIKDTVESIKYCMDNGFTDREGRLILMVMNRRANSPIVRLMESSLNDLVERGLLPGFKIPSIWSCGQVLKDIGPEMARKVMIRGFTTSEDDVEVVDACCDKSKQLIKLVKNWQGIDYEWAELQGIYNNQENENACPHYQDWKTESGVEFKGPLKERIYLVIDALCQSELHRILDDPLLKESQERLIRIEKLKTK